MTKQLHVVGRILPDGQTFTVKGRNAWALLELIKAGTQGVTPIDNPGPRWSAYVFKLKRENHLSIETRHEGHRGAFPGTHARYVLVSNVEIVSRSDSASQAAA
tara:strand:- start:94659 stop:94967 length:309 start_codon:yes stop_codon:yes gene_type:complete